MLFVYPVSNYISIKMENKEIEERLYQKNVKPTAIRIMIYKLMHEASGPLSLLDLENELDTVDKSTIFRTLMLFLSNHVVHAIEDGSGSIKYEICSNSCNCSIDDMHTHFYCESCHRTFCFKNINIPLVNMPDGFKMNSINYIIKGYCPECAAKL